VKVVGSIEEVRRSVAEARSAGKSVALVPTMGKLHEGHCSLIDAARSACDFVAVSIFVNPTQFGPGEDFESYPRSRDEDIAACRSRGVDLVFIPSVETMYARRALTTVSVFELSETLCGRNRPTHFAGVCTVVAKLLNIFTPDKAFFGAKDFQQSVIVRRMVEDLNFPVEIVVCPTVREGDGVAMSSRNEYLDPKQRKEAAALNEALQLAAEQITQSRPPAKDVIAVIRRHLESRVPGGEIDYVQIVDPNDLTDVETTDREVLIALAVRIAKARLIDNILVEGPSQQA